MHIDEAKASLVTLTARAQAQASLEISSSTVKALRDGLTLLKKSGKDTETHLREAHKALFKTVGVLRGMSQLKNATSTASVNASTSVKINN